MVSRMVASPARCEYVLVTDVPWTRELRSKYQNNMPAALGGNRTGVTSPNHIKEGLDALWEVCTLKMVEIAIERRLEFGKAQPVVAMDSKHAIEIEKKLKSGYKGARTYIHDGKSEGFKFSPESEKLRAEERASKLEEQGASREEIERELKTPSLDFIILLMNVAEGYDLHACDSMIRLPYPSGQHKVFFFLLLCSLLIEGFPKCIFCV